MKTLLSGFLLVVFLTNFVSAVSFAKSEKMPAAQRNENKRTSKQVVEIDPMDVLSFRFN